MDQTKASPIITSLKNIICPDMTNNTVPLPPYQQNERQSTSSKIPASSKLRYICEQKCVSSKPSMTTMSPKALKMYTKDIISLWVVESKVPRSSTKVKHWLSFHIIDRGLGWHDWSSVKEILSFIKHTG